MQQRTVFFVSDETGVTAETLGRGLRYSSPEQVRFELDAASELFEKYEIPCIDTTQSSVEEIASTILDRTGLERRSWG